MLPYDCDAYRHLPAYNPPKPACPPQPEPEPKPKCEPKPLVSSCKNMSGVANIPIINITAASPVPKTLGTISADLHCFSKPCVKLDLSALIVIGLATDVPFTITFRVYKRCDNQAEMEFNSFDVSIVNPVAAGTSLPISFNICDCCENCPVKCCTYRIMAEGTALAAITDYFSVNQGVLSILAADEC
ncbi:MAG TPA: hypothetical protein DDW65_22985 [Firmicutes bacterium]|nr:hypothetical protein [Bacillota bacterium]